MKTVWGIIVLIFLLIDNVAHARYGGSYYGRYGGGGGSGDPLVGIIIGSVIGGLCLIGGIITVICVIHCYNKKNTKVSANQQNGTGNSTMVSTTQQQQQKGAWQQPINPPPPPSPPAYTYGPQGDSFPPPPAYPSSRS
ncbi:uncharacterized protein [Argopecten irradians]|uniref:uncharacterized protein n=1 Tax=Argopecten irradians TaxID=31199 RepID=UPI003721D89B